MCSKLGAAPKVECTHIKLVGGHGHVRVRGNRSIGELGVELKEAGSKQKRRRQRIGLHPQFITVSFIQRKEKNKQQYVE